MTKITKTEKILRKATSKWGKFLAEGAFKKTLNESMDFRTAHFAAEMEPEELELLNIPEEEYKTKSKEEVEAIAAALSKAHKESQLGVILKYPKTATYDENEPILMLIKDKLKATRAITGEKGYVHYSDEESAEYADSYSNDMPSDHHEQKEPPVNEMTMGERGMVDAQDGNPPSKIGGGNEEYMAAFNAVMKKIGKEPLPIVQPDQAYLDALQRGNLEEQEDPKLAFPLSHNAPEVKSLEQGLKKMKDFHNKFPSDKTDKVLWSFIALRNAIKRAEESLYVEEGQLEENEKKTFQVGEFVYVVNGSLKGASGKILEPVTTTTGEEGFAIELYSDAKRKVFGKRGDEVIAVAGDLESGGTTDGMELYDIDERSADDERDLEKPVKYGSGAELEFDRKAQKFYDRKRDMYIDDPEEEDKLTREGIPSSMRTTYSSDPEMDQVMDIAADMLELSARSRIPVSLVGVESALKAQGFDTKMEKGMLIVDDKYVLADKNSLPASAQKISFTNYAADYLSNLQGEQQNLPM